MICFLSVQVQNEKSGPHTDSNASKHLQYLTPSISLRC